MLKQYKFPVFLTILAIITLSIMSCSRRTQNDKDEFTAIQDTVNIRILIENSASMAGYFKGTSFKSNITEFVAFLDKIRLKEGNLLKIDTIMFNTFSHNIKDTIEITSLASNVNDFTKIINEEKIWTAPVSPIDEIIKLLVDSSDMKTLNIFISDFVIDKKVKYLETIKSNFNLIFNNAKAKDIGLIIYRFTADFKGIYYPAIGSSQKVDSIIRPYFIWIFGNKNKLNIFRNLIQLYGNVEPENEIYFDLDIKPKNIEIMNLSNRIGNWRYKNDKFVKANLKNGNLKFTIAFNFSNLPIFSLDIDSLNKLLTVQSNTLEFGDVKFYLKKDFENLYHKKEKAVWNNNTHFLEVNVTQINSSENDITISLKKVIEDWYKKLSTKDDSSLRGDNNLKTFYLNEIISGIANAYKDFDSENLYFKLNLKLNK